MIWLLPGQGIWADPGTQRTDLVPGYGIVRGQISQETLYLSGAACGATAGSVTAGLPIYMAGAASGPTAGYPAAIEIATYAMVTQEAVEILCQSAGEVRVTQAAIEVLRDNVRPTTEAVLEVSLIVKAAAADEAAAQLVLGTVPALERMAPAKLYSRRLCRWRFRGPECGYTGPETSCGLRLADCIARGNEERFGGYPGIPWADLEA